MCRKVVKRVTPKSSHQQEKNFFFSLYLHPEMGTFQDQGEVQVLARPQVCLRVTQLVSPGWPASWWYL